MFTDILSLTSLVLLVVFLFVQSSYFVCFINNSDFTHVSQVDEQLIVIWTNSTKWCRLIYKNQLLIYKIPLWLSE